MLLEEITDMIYIKIQISGAGQSTREVETYYPRVKRR